MDRMSKKFINTFILGGTYRNDRNAEEILHLVDVYGAAVSVDEATAEKLKNLFVRVSSRLLPKDVQMLAESISCLSCLSLGAEPELLARMFTPLRGQVPFWPASVPEGVKLQNLAIWAKISVKDLDGLLAATRAIYTEEEFVALGLLLPLRCMTVFFEPQKKSKALR